MKFSISILAHNNLALTKRCVESVLANSEDFEILICDNGSTDGTHEYLKSLHTEKNIYFMRLEKNDGFIAPNRYVSEIANGDFLVLLNNDTIVPPGWLEAIEAPFLKDPLCAITGATGCAIGDNMIGHPSRNVEFIEGSCLMIRTAFAREIGLFDTNLVGAYGEDLDLSLRVRSMGYTIHTVPIDIKHLGGATSSMVPQANGWLKQNLAYLKIKWADYLKTRSFDGVRNAP